MWHSSAAPRFARWRPRLASTAPGARPPEWTLQRCSARSFPNKANANQPRRGSVIQTRGRPYQYYAIWSACTVTAAARNIPVGTSCTMLKLKNSTSHRQKRSSRACFRAFPQPAFIKILQSRLQAERKTGRSEQRHNSSGRIRTKRTRSQNGDRGKSQLRPFWIPLGHTSCLRRALLFLAKER